MLEREERMSRGTDRSGVASLSLRPLELEDLEDASVEERGALVASRLVLEGSTVLVESLVWEDLGGRRSCAMDPSGVASSSLPLLRRSASAEEEIDSVEETGALVDLRMSSASGLDRDLWLPSLVPERARLARPGLEDRSETEPVRPPSPPPIPL